MRITHQFPRPDENTELEITATGRFYRNRVTGETKVYNEDGLAAFITEDDGEWTIESAWTGEHETHATYEEARAVYDRWREEDNR